MVFDLILTVLGFILNFMAFFVIKDIPRTTGYELLLYSSYPTSFWFFIVGAIFCGLCVLLFEFSPSKKNQDRRLIFGLSVIIVSNSIIFLLPLLKGYTLYGRGDTLTHIGHIKDIVNTGHLSNKLLYPSLHILSFYIMEILGISYDVLIYFIFILFNIIYLLSMSLFDYRNSKTYAPFFLTVCFSTPLLYSKYHTSISPNIFSLYMIPFLLFLLTDKKIFSETKKYSIEKIILIFVSSYFIIFCHPMTTIYLLLLIVILIYSKNIYEFFNRSKQINSEPETNKSFRTIFFIIFIPFMIWYINFYHIQRSVITVYNWIFFQTGTPPYEKIIVTLEASKLTFFQTISVFINRFGAIFISLTISLLISSYIILTSIRRKNIQIKKLIFTIFFILSVFFTVFIMFGNVIERNPIRAARFGLMSGSILSALVLSDSVATARIEKKSFRNKSLKMVLTVLLMIMVIISIGNVHSSLRTVQENRQVTSMEIIGSKWFEEYRNIYLDIMLNEPSELRRFRDFNYGFDVSKNISQEERVLLSRIPSHFGYNINDSIAKTLKSQDSYILLTERDKIISNIFPENVRAKAHQYSTEDIFKLNMDYNASKIYSNGEFEIWLVTDLFT